MKFSSRQFLRAIFVLSLSVFILLPVFAMSGCTPDCEPGGAATVPLSRTTEERECRQAQGGIFLCVYNEDCDIQCDCVTDATDPGEFQTPDGQ